MGAVLETMIDDLKQLVEAESPSSDPQLLARSAEVVADLIERHLGTRPTLIDEGAGPHVHWTGGGDPKVLILGHHDTVFPAGTLDQRPFNVENGRATGPGVFDMKAGIVQAIHAVASINDRSGVEILLSCDEEVGSTTSRSLLEERAIACGTVLVLEPSGDGGALKTGRKGTGTFEVVIGGRAAHAGLEPHRGVNSLVEAAHQVLAIAEFADDLQETTVTPTVAHAGTADNVVPAETRIRVDVRVTSAEEAQRIEAAFADLAPVNPEATIEVNGRVGRPPMPESASAELMPLALAHDASVVGVAVGGGSDGNFTAARGVPTLDGLGAVGGGAHADHEYVEVETMPGRADLLAAIIEARTS
ncbi:MAG: M20 family metallopeptidase [Ilumatobacteraceae bacterium]